MEVCAWASGIMQCLVLRRSELLERNNSTSTWVHEQELGFLLIRVMHNRLHVSSNCSMPTRITKCYRYLPFLASLKQDHGIAANNQRNQQAIKRQCVQTKASALDRLDWNDGLQPQNNKKMVVGLQVNWKEKHAFQRNKNSNVELPRLTTAQAAAVRMEEHIS